MSTISFNAVGGQQRTWRFIFYSALLLIFQLGCASAFHKAYNGPDLTPERLVILVRPFGFWVEGGIAVKKIDGSSVPITKEFHLTPGKHTFNVEYFGGLAGHGVTSLNLDFDFEPGQLYCLSVIILGDRWNPIIWLVKSEPPPLVRAFDVNECRQRSKGLIN